MDQAKIILIALVLGILGTWLSKSLAWKLNFVNAPNPNVPQHTKTVAYMGGLGILIGLICAFTLLHFIYAFTIPIKFIGIACLYCAIGLYDDLAVLSVRAKLFFQFIVTIFALYLGVSYSFTNVLFIDYFLSFFGILLMINAVNLTDVCDGLVGGLSFIAFFIFSLYISDAAYISLVTAGSILGFLAFNKPQASIFMGDAGTHLIGFSLAYIFLGMDPEIGFINGFIPALLLAGVFLFEIIFLIVVRTQKGLKFWLGSQDHFSLRLQANGLSKWQTDIFAWIIGILVSIPFIVQLILKLDNSLYILSLCFSLLIFIAFWIYLLKIEKK